MRMCFKNLGTISSQHLCHEPLRGSQSLYEAHDIKIHLNKNKSGSKKGAKVDNYLEGQYTLRKESHTLSIHHLKESHPSKTSKNKES